jgi:hypothetical protein
MVAPRPKRQPVPHATVPRLLPNGGTVLVMGSGPSLTQADVDLALAHVDAVIAVNDSYKLAPDCTVLYAADSRWWGWHKGCEKPHKVGSVEYPAFTGRLAYCMTKTPWYPRVQVLKRGPQSGLCLDPQRVALGLNGAYQSINVAVHLGATRVILLGVDMREAQKHFFGQHPNKTGPPVTLCLERFATLVEPLRAAGVEVINCTRTTALKAFPLVPLEDALKVFQTVDTGQVERCIDDPWTGDWQGAQPA